MFCSRETIIRSQRQIISGDAEFRRRLVLFVVLDLAAVLFILVPGLIYLFGLDNGLSERNLVLYVLGLIAFQAAVVGLLLWKLGIVRGPQAE